MPLVLTAHGKASSLNHLKWHASALNSLADESSYGALTSTTLGIARAHHKIYVRDYHLRAASQPGMRLCWPEAGLLDSLVHGGSSGHARPLGGFPG